MAPQGGLSLLTPRETEVAALAAGGLSCPEIGERLYLGLNTVKTHLRHVYGKAGVRNRLELQHWLARKHAGDPELIPGSL
ncbi:MAG TPA: helix-turn-helix transcriptional regulator [Dehalococcoidia bacterium]|nr:helix-turn-helix transcriptional regulator [Dehalococcoidia bacterium]